MVNIKVYTCSVIKSFFSLTEQYNFSKPVRTGPYHKQVERSLHAFTYVENVTSPGYHDSIELNIFSSVAISEYLLDEVMKLLLWSNLIHLQL